ncbi:6407_t:CDS:2 [Entrophospora sp. SA101]|nr:6407_t:CDS:2 [Entrophospora sp. SA101]
MGQDSDIVNKLVQNIAFTVFDLRDVQAMSPRSVYTSGESFTEAVVKDEESGDLL